MNGYRENKRHIFHAEKTCATNWMILVRLNGEPILNHVYRSKLEFWLKRQLYCDELIFIAISTIGENIKMPIFSTQTQSQTHILIYLTNSLSTVRIIDLCIYTFRMCRTKQYMDYENGQTNIHSSSIHGRVQKFVKIVVFLTNAQRFNTNE